MIAVARIDPDGVVIAVREALHLRPRLPAVDRLEERRASLIRDVGVLGIDADLAVVHRAIHRVRQEPPRLPTIVRPPDSRLVRIGRRRRLIAAPAPTAEPGLSWRLQRAIVIHARAGSSARTDFDRRVDGLRPRARDVETDASEDRIVRQAVARELRP